MIAAASESEGESKGAGSGRPFLRGRLGADPEASFRAYPRAKTSLLGQDEFAIWLQASLRNIVSEEN